MNQRQKSITEYFTKQRCLRNELTFDTFNIVCSPLLTYHSNCDCNCLDLKSKLCQIYKNQQQAHQITEIPLEQCLEIIQQREQIRFKKQKEIVNSKKRKKLMKLTYKMELSQIQRQNIKALQELGYSNKLIAAAFNCSVTQVYNIKNTFNQIGIKREFFFSETEKQWIEQQSEKSSNSILYSAKNYLECFKQQFKNHKKLNLYQFRKLLSSLNIKYKTPQIKPLPYFYKNRNQEVITHIEKYCSLLIQKYKFIYIDECNLGNIAKNTHKQWHKEGSFKQQIHRISSNYCLMAAIGEQQFLRYQIISGTGKAHIFHNFLSSVIEAANNHYGQDSFVIVLDNCSIHKCNFTQDLLGSVQHLFTPTYRPEFNGIEHLFGWLKRRIAKSQPLIMSSFMYQIHNNLNDVTNEFLENWCQSVEKHMYSFMKVKFNLN